jgi:hypothetical protein
MLECLGDEPADFRFAKMAVAVCCVERLIDPFRKKPMKLLCVLRAQISMSIGERTYKSLAFVPSHWSSTGAPEGESARRNVTA